MRAAQRQVEEAEKQTRDAGRLVPAVWLDIVIDEMRTVRELRRLEEG